MGVKVLQCFPWSRNSKERSRSRQSTIHADTSVQEKKPQSPVTPAWHDEGAQRSSWEARHVCLTHKALICLRHRLDGNVIDSTN